MIDLKITDADRKEMKSEEKNFFDREKYPWGTRLNFDDQTFKKLGIDLPKVGTKISLSATGVVCGTNVHDDKESMEVQLEMIELNPEKKKEGKGKEAIAKDLYGED